MVRSMYSGVAGMKAHQTRMDVIGNNIANVNTYGYKSSRASFRDMFYQNIRSSSAGTANRGGINPSSIGYGSSISSVDVLMSTSTMTSTGNPLDVAITGEGFLQVMDTSGNIFYTKAGMLDIDSNGNVIDTNGFFVLGTSGNPLGKSPASNKIQIEVPSVAAKLASVVETINGIQYSIEASNYTTSGNVSFNFNARSNLPVGQDMQAVIDGSNININVSSTAVFADLNAFQDAVNRAITEANGGVPHPAGQFQMTMSSPQQFQDLTGAQICGTNYGIDKGTVSLPATLNGLIKLDTVGDEFNGAGDVTYSLAYDGSKTPPSITVQAVISDGTTTNTYTREITQNDLTSPKSVLLSNGAPGASPNDCLTLSFPSWRTLIGASDDKGDAVNLDPVNGAITWDNILPPVTDPINGPFHGTSTPSTPALDLGLSSKPITLKSGTQGGPQGVSDLTGITIGSGGVIVASHDILGELVIGRIDLATFGNPRALQLVGNSYFSASANSGDPSLSAPGENGTGSLLNSSLELSNVDLSQEFSDMIVTQRGFQANSRLITVSDTMLEELINLKR